MKAPLRQPSLRTVRYNKLYIHQRSLTYGFLVMVSGRQKPTGYFTIIIHQVTQMHLLLVLISAFERLQFFKALSEETQSIAFLTANKKRTRLLKLYLSDEN